MIAFGLVISPVSTRRYADACGFFKLLYPSSFLSLAAIGKGLVCCFHKSRKLDCNYNIIPISAFVNRYVPKNENCVEYVKGV